MVKNLPAIQETQIQSLGQEDPLEKGMATPSLAWEIPRTEEPGGLQSVGVRESDMTEQLAPSLSYIYTHASVSVCAVMASSTAPWTVYVCVCITNFQSFPLLFLFLT